MVLNPIVDSRDVRFILFEILEADKLTKFDKYADFDKDMFEDVIDLAETIAVEQVYPMNAETDKEHAQYIPDTKDVKIPEAYKPALDAYYEAGFMGLAVDQEYGGMGMPDVIYQAAIDYFSSASVAFTMYPVLSIGAMNLCKNFLPDGDLKNTAMEKMISGEWGGTMCLTEPDAGSDVGALKSKAKKNDDGTYNVSGQKIFISSGENDYRNDVICSGIEHKMGITASATCSMSFGDENNCKGILFGEERKGMKIMFQMMNEARLYVGSQGMSVSSAAYMHAVTYAKNRIQGAHVSQMTNPDAKGVAIVEHPDVKRMLLSMKAKVEAMRTLTYLLAYYTDLTHVEEGEAKKEAQALLDFLIPINKAGNTDTAWEVTSDAIQTYGGFGFCADYPVEQFARDAKILAIYEGTNGIQSIDLAMRKLLMNKDQYNYEVFKKTIEADLAKAKGVSGQFYIGSLLQNMFGKLDSILKGDRSVNEASTAMFTGALEE